MQLEALVGTLGYRFDDSGLKQAQAELKATHQVTEQHTAGLKAGAEWSDQYGAKLKAAATATGLFAAAGALGTAAILDAVGAAKEYDAVMANVATLSPEAAAKTGEFKKEVLDLSARMGGDAVESANAMYDALSSGIPPDNVMTFMTSASKFAVAGATDVGTAVKGLAGTINAWGHEASEATAISDTFFQGQNLGVFRVDELASSIGNVSGLAASLDISYKDVTASTATMTLQNMTAAESITRQRAAIVSIITPNEKMSKVMKDLAATYPEVAAAAEAEGISIGEAAFKTLGFQGTLEAVRGSATNTSTVLAEATGSVEALGGILALTGDNAALARTNLDAMNGSAGSTEAAFAILSETTDQKWKVMQATFNNTRIVLGDAFLPVVSSAIDLMAPLADAGLAVARAFSEAPTPIKAIVAVLGLLVTGGAAVGAAIAGMAAMVGPNLIALTGSTVGLTGSTGALALAWHSATAAVVTGARAAMAAVAPMAAPLLVVTGVVLALKAGHDDLSSSMDEAYKGAQRLGGGFGAYLTATKQAQAETTGLGKVFAFVNRESALESDQIRTAGKAYLEHSLNVDKAVLSNTAFQQGAAQLAMDAAATPFGPAKLSAEEYQAALEKLADETSAAMDKGHLLTTAQKELQASFASATSVLLERAGPQAAALAQDEEFVAKQKELSAAMTDGTMTQQQALVDMKAYIAGRGEQAAADQAAAQAAADGANAATGAVEMYSKSLQQLSGGSAVSFAPDAERSKEDIKEMQKQAEQLRDERVSHFADMYNKRQEFQAQEAILIGQGKTTELATLREGYANELIAQQEHLGQLAVNQIMANLQNGTLAEEQAQLMLGSLQAAMPDADFLSGNLAAMTNFSATLGGAMRGNTEDALNLGGALQQVPADLDAGAAAAEDYEQRAVDSYEAARLAAEGSATGVVAADQAVMVAGLLRMQAAGEALTAEQQALLDTAQVAKAEGAKTGAALLDVGGAAQTAQGRVASTTSGIKADVGSVPGAVAKAASDVKTAAAAFGDGFSVAAQKAQEGQRQTLGALEETLSRQKSGMDETTRAGLTGETAHKQIAAGAQASKAAVTEYGDAAVEHYGQATQGAKQNEEQTRRLDDALRALPKDIRTNLTLVGIEKFTTDIAQIKADLADLPERVVIPVSATYSGRGAMEEGHSLRLQHDLEDIYAVVKNNGPLTMSGSYVAGHPAMEYDGVNIGLTKALNFSAEAVLALDAALTSTSTQKLGWQVALESYYEQLALAPVYVDKFMEIVNQALGSGGNWEKIMAEWSNKALNGWLDLEAAIGPGKNVQMPDWRLLTGDPDTAKKEWERFWDDVARQEEERARMANEWYTRQSRRFDQGGNETMSEKIEEQWDLEKQRHESVMNMIELERIASDRNFERDGDYYKELQRLLKAAEDAIKAQQKSEVDAENSAHSQVTEQIEDEVRRRKELHDRIASDIEERKRIEAEAYAASTRALDEQARQIKLADEQRSRALAAYKASIQSQKDLVDIDGAKRQLEELKTAASEFASVLGKLDETKKVEDDQAKRRKEKVKLHTDAQREMLRKYGHMVADEDRRTVDLLLAGYEVRGSEADRLMAQIQAGLQDSVGVQEGVVDAKQQELDRLQELIRQAEAKAKIEKDASDDQLKVIEEIKRKSSEAHTEYVRQLDLEKRQEDERYKSEQSAIAKLKDAEGDRHAARLKQINEQYALELLKLGKTEAEVAQILAERQAEAERIASEADRRYREAIEAIDAESRRLQGEQASHEQDVRSRVATMQRELIERMRAVAQAIGGDAGAAIDAMLAKLLSGETGIPAATIELIRMGEAGVSAVVAIGKAVEDLGKQQQDVYRKAQREEAARWRLPKEKLNATTRRGRGGFRAGHDWEEWHRQALEADKDWAGGMKPGGGLIGSPGSAPGLTPGGDLIAPPGSGGMPNPGGKGSGAWPYPWRYGKGGGAEPDKGAEPYPWRYAAPTLDEAREAASVVLGGFLDPVNEGLAEMIANLKAASGLMAGMMPLIPDLVGSGSSVNPVAGGGVTLYNYGTINYADPLLDAVRDGVNRSGGSYGRRGSRP